MESAQTAVVVLVPEAEPVVGPWRAEMDEAAGWGVPAHVTVLFPFLPVDRIDGAVLAKLAEAVAETPAFEAAFPGTAWFGDEVMWLRPEPAEAFRALTRAVWQRFPECPPYGGEHPEVTPHLTVAHRQPRADMERAERAVAAGLPIRARVTHVALLTGPTSAPVWESTHTFRLGPETG